MPFQSLTVRAVTARAVVLKLKRPVVARIATITEWPLILIDLQTEEGVVGRSYLEPYTIKTMKYLIPALHERAAERVSCRTCDKNRAARTADARTYNRLATHGRDRFAATNAIPLALHLRLRPVKGSATV